MAVSTETMNDYLGKEPGLRCAACGKQWGRDAIAGFAPWVWEYLVDGAGCLGCMGKPKTPWMPTHLNDFSPGGKVLLEAWQQRQAGHAQQWLPPVMQALWQCNLCRLAVRRHALDDSRHVIDTSQVYKRYKHRPYTIAGVSHRPYVVLNGWNLCSWCTKLCAKCACFLAPIRLSHNCSSAEVPYRLKDDPLCRKVYCITCAKNYFPGQYVVAAIEEDSVLNMLE